MYAGQTVIYADILFLINFSLDYLALFFAGRLLNRKSKPWALVIASTLGGLYGFLPYIIELPSLAAMLLHILFAGLMCLLAFGLKPKNRFWLLWLSFIVFSALLGGLITAFYSMSGRYSNGVYTEVSPVSFVLICLLSAGICFVYSLISKNKIHATWAEIRVYIGDTKFTARLLSDSGNLVTEPFSALPVIIISASALPPPYDNPECEAFPLRVRAIPFNTAAGQSCFLGFKPDKTEILRLGRSPINAEAYIAVDTSNNNYSGYDGIIPTSLF